MNVIFILPYMEYYIIFFFKKKKKKKKNFILEYLINLIYFKFIYI